MHWGGSEDVFVVEFIVGICDGVVWGCGEGGCVSNSELSS